MNLKDFYSKIYIIHYKPLTDRKNYLVSKFEEFGLTDMVEWVDQFETDDEVKKIKNPFNLPKKLLAVNAAHMYCYKNQLPYDNLKEYFEWYKKTYPWIWDSKKFNI